MRLSPVTKLKSLDEQGITVQISKNWVRLALVESSLSLHNISQCELVNFTAMIDERRVYLTVRYQDHYAPQYEAEQCI